MFDIQYANLDNETYDPSCHYSFFRRYKNQLLLVIVNFSENESNIRIKIPKELFEHFKIKENQLLSWNDLISEESFVATLSSDINIDLFVGEYGIRLLKLSL